MIEGPSDGYGAFRAHVGLDAGSGLAAAKAEEEDEVSSLNFAAGQFTSQRPVSLVGWSGALLVGASLWAMLFVLVG